MRETEKRERGSKRERGKDLPKRAVAGLEAGLTARLEAVAVT